MRLRINRNKKSLHLTRRGWSDNPGRGLDWGEDALDVARALARAAEARDPYSWGHAERVAILATDIAVQMGLSHRKVAEIQVAGILHDIGKVFIRDEVLLKPARLTPAEWTEVKRHPGAAAEIIRHLDCFKDAIPIVEGHHEWYDGTGYPNRLKGEEIPLGARVLAVADAYDAMTSPRPYRTRLTEEEAVQSLRDGAGTQWDPQAVEAFVAVIERETELLKTLLVEA